MGINDASLSNMHIAGIWRPVMNPCIDRVLIDYDIGMNLKKVYISNSTSLLLKTTAMLLVYYTHIIILRQLNDDSCIIQPKTITLGDAVTSYSIYLLRQSFNIKTMFHVWAQNVVWI